MMKTIKRGLTGAMAVFSVLMVFLPEGIFSNELFISKEFMENSRILRSFDVGSLNIVVMRVVVFGILFVASVAAVELYSKILLRKVKIEGNNYFIVIEYGDLLNKKNCQRIINFDECYTTNIGTKPEDIKKDSVCGQYLIQNPDLEIHELIEESGIRPCRRKSEYKNSTCYEPGTIVANGDDLLMAFTRLEENGKSKKFTVKEYLECLNRMWEQIDNNYCNKDVYLPVLGSGIARFENGTSQSISKQELVDLMISSYRLSPYKLKNKNSLHIVCKRSDDFSMDKVK